VAVPDFTLPDQAGRRWHLADHLDGAVVLAFYRGDW
jgi:peroxiredoxin